MANSNEAQNKSTPKMADKLPQPSKATNKNANSAITSTNKGSFLAIIVAIIALIGAIYAIYTNKQSNELNELQSQKVNQLFNQLKQQQSDAQNDLEAIKSAANQLQVNLQNQLQTMNTDLQSALQQRLYQKQDWLLLKARYYLELAQINAHWSSDQETTIALLQQADALLRNIPEQQLFAVRQAIAQEIMQLQTLPKIDIAGLLSQLDAAENAVANLPIKKPLNSTQPKKSNESNASPWRQKLHESMNVLEKLVVIRRNDEDIQPLLSPLHQTLLRDSIRFNLQEAQWALLQNNSKIFQLSLAQALKEINRAFDENAVATQALIKQLQNLQQEKLETITPTLNQSLSLLNQLIESKNTQNTEIPATTEGAKTQ
ncbi:MULTISPECIES: uroporphyrinogen-III C-methyltransferase [Legionella]|uniref:Uroporphyrinogen III methylase n=1 Tax=Legionella maceachernii TaxID=466 RepID=A0A0W0VZE4_9GAMM|nr:uroporphyrinogen-III C-methyltransferase [Legionella maceachernii]KTD25499.1 uroporphyrinogen III methylase [Legionella maceachernii]SJZ54533.1 uroporphyrin-3 C-methyltransferase [Legionella maceachernii]SUP00354.1 Putative uroporphyrinogen-III C-methyltransferase [Legionella maceachernii]